MWTKVFNCAYAIFIFLWKEGYILRYVKTARLDLRLHSKDKDALKKYCSEHNIKMTDFIVNLIRKELNLEEKKEKENT